MNDFKTELKTLLAKHNAEIIFEHYPSMFFSTVLIVTKAGVKLYEDEQSNSKLIIDADL